MIKKEERKTSCCAFQTCLNNTPFWAMKIYFYFAYYYYFYHVMKFYLYRPRFFPFFLLSLCLFPFFVFYVSVFSLFVYLSYYSHLTVMYISHLCHIELNLTTYTLSLICQENYCCSAVIQHSVFNSWVFWYPPLICFWRLLLAESTSWK